MKNTFLFISLIPCVLSLSCVNRESRPNAHLLQQSQLLVEQNPDSALSLLDAINPFDLSKSKRADYSLLRVQARSNAGADLSTDTEIFAVADFFTRKNDPEKAALSCFYAALVAAYQNPKQALEYYQQANDFAQISGNKILQWKTLYNMGVSSYTNYWYDVSVTQYRQALKILHQLDNQYQRVARTLSAVANSKVMMNQTDSAHFYYQSALNLIQQHNDSALLFMVYNNMGATYRYQANLDSANHYSKRALQLAVSDDDKVTAYLNLVYLYYIQSRQDSAKYYIQMAENMLNNSDDILKLTSLANFSYQIEKRDGNYPKALEYLELYHAHYSELLENNDRKLLLEMQKKYNVANKENELIKKKNRALKFAGVSLMFLLALAIFSIYMLRTNMKQKEALAKEKLALQMAKLENFEKTVELENIMMQVQTLQVMSNQRDNKMKTLFIEKMGIIKKIALLSPYFNGNALKDRSNELKIMLKLSDILKDMNLQNFIDIANELYPDFTARLKQSYSDLDDREISICCLLLFDFKNRELDLLVNHRIDNTLYSVQTWKSTIRRKLNLDFRGDIKAFLLQNIVKNNWNFTL